MDTSGGTVDQPSVYAEQPGTHVAWVSWDNINVPFNGGGKRPWIRRLHFRANGMVDFTPKQEVRIDCNLSCVKLDSQNIAAYCDPAHAGTDNCVGGTETEVIAFPRVNNSPFNDTALIDNQGAGTCASMFDVQWKTSISIDGGSTWTQGVGNSDGSTLMGEDPVWPNCIVPGARANAGNNRGRMSLYHDDQLLQWHAYWTKETFNAFPGPNTLIWAARLSHDLPRFLCWYGLRGDRPGLQRGWCWLPRLAVRVLPRSVHAASGVDAVGSCDHPCGSVARHTARYDDSTRDDVVDVSKLDGNIGSFSGNDSQIAQVGAPWAFTGTNGNTPWGDYEGMDPPPR